MYVSGTQCGGCLQTPNKTPPLSKLLIMRIIALSYHDVEIMGVKLLH